MGEMTNAHKFFNRNPEERRSCRRPMHRWEDNVGLDLRDTGYEGVDWMYLAMGRDRQTI
jgi:hypothetical protein